MQGRFITARYDRIQLMQTYNAAGIGLQKAKCLHAHAPTPKRGPYDDSDLSPPVNRPEIGQVNQSGKFTVNVNSKTDLSVFKDIIPARCNILTECVGGDRRCHIAGLPHVHVILNLVENGQILRFKGT